MIIMSPHWFLSLTTVLSLIADEPVYGFHGEQDQSVLFVNTLSHPHSLKRQKSSKKEVRANQLNSHVQVNKTSHDLHPEPFTYEPQREDEVKVYEYRDVVVADGRARNVLPSQIINIMTQIDAGTKLRYNRENSPWISPS